MAPIKYRKVFVTVGTTQFEDLIDSLNSPPTAAILEELGCTHLTVQYGSGKEPDLSRHYRNVRTETFAYKSSIAADIAAADLVISHAGAGSVIETLKASKPMVVVANPLLMDNHQTELAHQMYEDGHALYCDPATLAESIGELLRKMLRPYDKPEEEPAHFLTIVDKLMGYA